MGVNFPIDLGTFPLYRGDDEGRNKVTITLTDSDDAPVDLTAFGDTWTSQARTSARAADAIDLTVDVSEAADGVLEVRLPVADSADLPGRLVFDVQVTGGAISPLTVFAGTFNAEGQVTR